MKNDLSPRSAAVYVARRRNKSIWMKGSLIVALFVAMLTGYALIFPARTVDRELICGQQEHVHSEDCWLAALTCGLEEGEEHTHTPDCYTTVTICGLEEHVHTDECFAVPETEAPTEAPTELQTEAPTETPTEPLTEAPAESTETPADPEPEEPATEPAATEPAGTEAQVPETEPVTEPAEPDPAGQTEPAATEPEGSEPAQTEPADPEEPGETAEPSEPEEPGETAEPAEPGRQVELNEVTGNDRQDEPGWWEEYEENGIDLAPYLESAVFQRQEGNILVEDDLFVNGESARASIVYNIPEQIVTPESRYVFYQLPEGIQPIEETSGDVMNDGVPVGIYTITEEGVIHILFNEDFANGSAIEGTVDFSSYLYANDDGTDRVVEFENESGRITITVPDEQRYDLSLLKSGSFTADYQKAEFVLSVISEKSTGGNGVVVTDHLINQTPASLFSAVYDQSDFRVVFVDAEAQETELSDFTVVWDEDNMHFTLEGLPPLGAGERFNIYYSVDLEPDLSSSFELDNVAKASSGVLEAETSFFITYVCDITKTGQFNPQTGLIDWVIAINPDSRPVAGWRIEDYLPYSVIGSVQITNANGAVYATTVPTDNGRKINYTFPPDAPARPYFLRYSTLAPIVSETVTNIVHLYNERETIVEASVEVVERSEGVDKSVDNSYMRAEGMVQTYWDFVVSMPLGELESYTFRDVISGVVQQVATGEILNSALHYGCAAELEAAFRGNLHMVSDGKSWYYGDPENNYVNFEICYYDAAGNLIDPADETTHVAHLSIKLTPVQGSSFHGYEISASHYPTWLDASAAQVNDYWMYQNYMVLPGGEIDQANAFYRKGEAFVKQIRTGDRFSEDNVSLSYEDCGGELEYRLVLNLDALSGEEFTVVDLLPEGTELVADSPRAYFTNDNFIGEYNGSFVLPENFSYTVNETEDGTLVSFHGAGVSELMRETYGYICVVYRVRLSDETLWNEYTQSSETFTNRATWGDFEDSLSTTVTSEPIRLQKDGVPLLDEEGKPNGKMKFHLLINAAGEDLDPESDWIILSDTLTAEVAANLDLSSFRLYHHDPNAPDHLGEAVRPYEYRLSYNPLTHEMEVRLKDETPYVMTYEYRIDINAVLIGETVVDNSATLAGRFESHSSIPFRNISSNATARQSGISITKVDVENHALVLAGAEFMLEHWDVETQAWIRVLNPKEAGGNYTTGADGTINADVLSFVGKLCRLTEVKAPVGYDAEGTELLFICVPKDCPSSQQAYEQAAVGSGISSDEIVFFGEKGGSYVITNPFTGVKVEKYWRDQDGNITTKILRDYIEVSLYVTTDPSGETGRTLVPASENIENPVRITAEDNWSYTWEHVPPRNENGEQLYYFVEETSIPGYNVSYTYINNGITGCTIVITNTCEPYELPSTGGTGSRRFVGLGIMLMSLTAIVYINKIKKMEEKQ